MTPKWVIDLLERAEANAVTGFITINMRSGAYRDVKVEETYFPPASLVGKDEAECPRCGGVMKAIDAIYICGCGTKRTRVQMAAQSGR